jgi:DNA-binding GntR family transcriptional regulator
MEAAALSLARQAYEHLLTNITSGVWPPGTLLNRRSVADSLGFSVAPVLEAIVQLESEGLLETLPRKGTRVCLISAERQYDLWIMREALECQAVRLACGAPVRAAWTKLAALAAAADLPGSRPAKHYQNEVAFHRALAACAGSALLLREFDRHIRVGFFFALQQTLAGVAPRGMALHAQLLKRFKQADPDSAERAMREHLWPTHQCLDSLRQPRQPLTAR